MKIVVLDGYTLNPGDITWDGLKKLGDLTVYDRTSFDNNEKEMIIQRSKDADILFTCNTTLTKDILDNLENLKYIGVLSTGYDMVDTKAAKEKGIVVTNIPTYGTAAVAQMTFALLLEICHHVGSHSDAVFRGDWSNNLDWCFWNYPLIELEGKTMGIIGYGRIGQKVGEIAQAFGLKVLATTTKQRTDYENGKLKYVSLEELFASSDIISLHCPLTEATKGIINKGNIEKMKDGVILVNASRGSLVVEGDLANALNEGKIAGAAVDVVSSEPISPDNPLLMAKNCIITPHIAWAPIESRLRLMDIAVNNLKCFLENRPVNVVN